MIVDSVIWIALKYEKDKFHSKANKIRTSLFERNQIYVTDYIIIETYSFILRKVGIETAVETLKMFQTSDRITVIYNDVASFKETLELVNVYPFLSIVDANIVYHSKKLDIGYFTFDERLDQIKIK